MWKQVKTEDFHLQFPAPHVNLGNVNMDEEIKRQYELNYILSAQTPEEEVLSFQRKIEEHIKAISGEIKEAKQPARQQLAYKIKKEAQGLLGEIIFEVSPSVLSELETKLKMEKNLLRYAIVNHSTLLRQPRKETGSAFKPRDPIGIAEKPAESRTEEQLPRSREEKKEEKTKLEEIDKKLEEILGM